MHPVTLIKEIKFFVGMVPVTELPLQAICEALESILSCRVGMITLDLNTMDTGDVHSQEFLKHFQKLDFNLYWIALAREEGRQTVVRLSANDPFVIGLCLHRFRSYGKLVLGTRSGGLSSLGDVQWYEE